MSVLTKVFVVLVTILSVLLVALVVPFVANTENYKGQLEEARRQKAAAEAAAASIQEQIGRLQTAESTLVTELNAKITSLTQANQEEARRRLAAENALTQVRAENAKLTTDLSRLSAAHDMLANVNKTIAEELNQRRTDMVQLQTQLIQQIDQTKSLASQVETLNHQVRRFSEQVQLLDEEKKALETQLAMVPQEMRGGATATQAAPVSPTRIVGQVARVQTADGETLIQINVGRNDGVVENMKFIVFRGQQYLGTMRVRVVDERSAAGRLELRAGSAQIAEGDQVQTGPTS